MSTNTLPTYTIRIDEQQRRVLQTALYAYLSAASRGKGSFYGIDVAESLRVRLEPAGFVGLRDGNVLNDLCASEVREGIARLE